MRHQFHRTDFGLRCVACGKDVTGLISDAEFTGQCPGAVAAAQGALQNSLGGRSFNDSDPVGAQLRADHGPDVDDVYMVAHNAQTGHVAAMLLAKFGYEGMASPFGVAWFPVRARSEAAAKIAAKALYFTAPDHDA